MSIRTDLAIELRERIKEDIEGVKQEEFSFKNATVKEIEILNETAQKEIGRPKGKYITVEIPQLERICDFESIKEAIIFSLKRLVEKERERVMVVGLGNPQITPDAIGPFTADKILATRHIEGSFAEKIGLKGIKSVSVIKPDVLGKTGIETSEYISGICQKINPDLIIAVDALACSNIRRVYRTVQLCNTGISPGSGVKNARKELSRKTLSVPVIAVGVPTVTDAAALEYELTGKIDKEKSSMIITSKDADLLTEKISEVLSDAINVFLQPEIEPEVILALV